VSAKSLDLLSVPDLAKAIRKPRTHTLVRTTVVSEHVGHLP
jgi:hypothetical protein